MMDLVDGPAPPKRRRGSQKVVDWAAIEKDWLPGIMSVAQVSEVHGVSRRAIDKHFDALGMRRDLKPQIMAKAKTLVAASLVAPVVNYETKYTDTTLIEAGATEVARTVVRHKVLIERHAEIACRLLEELEATTNNKQLFDQLGELLHAPDERGVDKLNEVYEKVMSLPSRVDSYKKLSDSLKTLIGLQRQAVGLSDNGNGEADKPPVLPSADVNNDVARRIAFVLSQAGRKTP